MTEQRFVEPMPGVFTTAPVGVGGVIRHTKLTPEQVIQNGLDTKPVEPAAERKTAKKGDPK